jgi:hypothetical protein
MCIDCVYVQAVARNLVRSCLTKFWQLRKLVLSHLHQPWLRLTTEESKGTSLKGDVPGRGAILNVVR